MTQQSANHVAAASAVNVDGLHATLRLAGSRHDLGASQCRLQQLATHG